MKGRNCGEPSFVVKKNINCSGLIKSEGETCEDHIVYCGSALATSNEIYSNENIIVETVFTGYYIFTPVLLQVLNTVEKIYSKFRKSHQNVIKFN